MNKLILIAFYLFLWVIFAEKITIESIIIGLVIITIVIKLNKDLFTNTKFYFHIKKIKYYIKYFLVLIVEVIKANIQVAIIVLSKNPNLDPCIIEYKTKIMSEFHQMILANSITLTPGTLTISIDNNIVTVHCLKKDFADGLYNSKFEELLIRIEELNNAII